MEWTEESKRNFDAAMEEEKRYAAREYRAVELRDYKDAEFSHNMRWKMMDKAVSLLRTTAVLGCVLCGLWITAGLASAASLPATPKVIRQQQVMLQAPIRLRGANPAFRLARRHKRSHRKSVQN